MIISELALSSLLLAAPIEDIDTTHVNPGEVQTVEENNEVGDIPFIVRLGLGGLVAAGAIYVNYQYKSSLSHKHAVDRGDDFKV